MDVSNLWNSRHVGKVFYDNVQGVDYDKIWSFIAIFGLDGLK